MMTEVVYISEAGLGGYKGHFTVYINKSEVLQQLLTF